MIKQTDLASWQEPEDLIDAIWEVRRGGHTEFRDDVVALLEHEDPIVRGEAYSLLLTKWRDANVRERAVEALLRDSDFGVRNQAAIGIAALSTVSTRQEDLDLFRGIIFDPDEDPLVQRACYEALCLMVGRKPPAVNRDFHVQEEGDLAWIRSL